MRDARREGKAGVAPLRQSRQICPPPPRYYIFAEAEKAGYFVKTTTNTDFEG